MPDGIVIEIPLSGTGENDMAEPTAQFAALHDQNMAGMGQAMTQFMANSTTISKATDYQHLAGLGLPSLEEAAGMREVTSRVTPAGPVPATAKD